MFACRPVSMPSRATRCLAGLLLCAAVGMPSAFASSLAQFRLEAGCELKQDGELSEPRLPSAERRQTTANGVTVCAASMPLLSFERAFKLCAVSYINVPAKSGGHACGVVYGPVEVDFRFQHAANHQPPACSFTCLINEAQ